MVLLNDKLKDSTGLPVDAVGDDEEDGPVLREKEIGPFGTA